MLFICQKHISDKCINENLLFLVVYKNCLILSFNCLQILHTSLFPRLISGVYIDDVQDNCFILYRNYRGVGGYSKLVSNLCIELYTIFPLLFCTYRIQNTNFIYSRKSNKRNYSEKQDQSHFFVQWLIYIIITQPFLE